MGAENLNEEEKPVESNISTKSTNNFLKILADNLFVILAGAVVIAVLFFIFCNNSNHSNGDSTENGSDSTVVIYDTTTVYPSLISFAQNSAQLNVYEAYVFSQIDKSFLIGRERYEYTLLVVGKVLYSISLENIDENVDFFVDSTRKVITIHIDSVCVSSCEPLLDRSRIISHSDAQISVQEAFDDAFETIELAKAAMIRQADAWGVRDAARLNAEVLLNMLYEPLDFSVEVVWDNTGISRSESSSTSSRGRR